MNTKTKREKVNQRIWIEIINKYILAKEFKMDLMLNKIEVKSFFHSMVHKFHCMIKFQYTLYTWEVEREFKQKKQPGKANNVGKIHQNQFCYSLTHYGNC